jgi:membrane-bound metal-dependent hydrolase YbcI (DUF457 family)
MPSPIGHFLGGLVAGHLAAAGDTAGPVGPTSAARPVAGRVRQLLGSAAIRFGLLGALPDIDFLFGIHSMYTHSVGAALFVGLITYVATRPKSVRFALAGAAAYGSHIVLDWLGDDTTPPIGIMALWPFANGYYQSDLHWFMAINRRYWLDNFWSHNLAAVSREVVLLGPLALAAWWIRCGRVAGARELR